MCHDRSKQACYNFFLIWKIWFVGEKVTVSLRHLSWEFYNAKNRKIVHKHISGQNLTRWANKGTTKGDVRLVTHHTSIITKWVSDWSYTHIIQMHTLLQFRISLVWMTSETQFQLKCDHTITKKKWTCSFMCVCVMCDALCVMCDEWCVMCYVEWVVRYVWCVMSNALCAMCNEWCVMSDALCVMCDVWSGRLANFVTTS